MLFLSINFLIIFLLNNKMKYRKKLNLTERLYFIIQYKKSNLMEACKIFNISKKHGQNILNNQNEIRTEYITKNTMWVPLVQNIENIQETGDIVIDFLMYGDTSNGYKNQNIFVENIEVKNCNEKTTSNNQMVEVLQPQITTDIVLPNEKSIENIQTDSSLSNIEKKTTFNVITLENIQHEIRHKNNTDILLQNSTTPIDNINKNTTFMIENIKPEVTYKNEALLENSDDDILLTFINNFEEKTTFDVENTQHKSTKDNTIAAQIQRLNDEFDSETNNEQTKSFSNVLLIEPQCDLLSKNYDSFEITSNNIEIEQETLTALESIIKKEDESNLETKFIIIENTLNNTNLNTIFQLDSEDSILNIIYLNMYKTFSYFILNNKEKIFESISNYIEQLSSNTLEIFNVTKESVKLYFEKDRNNFNDDFFRVYCLEYYNYELASNEDFLKTHLKSKSRQDILFYEIQDFKIFQYKKLLRYLLANSFNIINQFQLNYTTELDKKNFIIGFINFGIQSNELNVLTESIFCILLHNIIIDLNITSYNDLFDVIKKDFKLGLFCPFFELI